MRPSSLTPALLAILALVGCAPQKDDSSTDANDSPAETGPLDADNDGYAAAEDCDDSNADINPGATEVCNELDDDCDSVIDTDATDTTTYYLDADADGYGVPDTASTVSACSLPEGYAALTDDCDDANADYHPGAEESDCSDPNDYNCDGLAGAVDNDADGFFACEECDDGNTAVNPLAAEVCNDIDDNCDTVTDTDAVDAPTWYTDADSDTYGDSATAVISCEAPAGTVAVDGDCDDTSTVYNPAADESDCADPNDYNCDGSVGYVDADGDGFAACTECDDSDGAINSSAAEACDGVDNNCDGTIDEAGATGESTWFLDADADGYGDATASVVSCSAPEGYVADSTDCDDALDTFNPGADESDCTDANDYNCDGSVGYADADGDGSAACEDCDDANADAFPGGVEICDGADNDCDTNTDEASALDASAWYADSDGDTFGDAAATVNACAQPDGFVADDTDCDDARDADFPGADELCDNHDNDCDGSVDTDALDANEYYADSDDDGYGDVTDFTAACTAPAGYVEDASDCDDAESSTFPGASETCDGVDNDCDDAIDDGLSGAWYLDADGDGYGDPDVGESSCGAPSGYVADDTDCDDADYAVHPDASDTCDGVDTDCNGVVDNNTAPTAPVVSIAPASPRTDDALTAQRDTASYDADGDALTYTYQWTRDGVSSGTTASIAASATNSGQTWSVQVSASDGCAAGPAGTASVTIANTAPTLTSVVLAPDPAYEDDVLTCTAGATTDADGDAVGLSYEWVVNGAALGFDSDSLDSGSFDRGDSIYCTATPTDGTDDGATRSSSTVTIENSAPSIAAVSISPASPKASSTLTCSYSGYADIDGDADQSTYAWTVDGVLVGTGSTLSGAFVGNDVVTCTVTPDDGTDAGSPVSSSVTIGNTAPVMGTVSISPSTAYNDDLLTCSASATDVDGGTPTLTYAWTNTSTGSAIGSGATLSLSSTLAASRATVACAVTATDADGGTATGSASLTLGNRAPVATASLTPGSPTRASTLTCAGLATDADADSTSLTFGWTVGGSAVAASSTTATTSSLTGAFSTGQLVVCTVTASDGTSGSGTATASVTIANTAPVVSSVTLAPSTVYTNDTLTANVVSSDDDGDTLSLSYDWYVNSALVQSGASASLSGAAHFSRGQAVYVTATANDGPTNASATSSSVTVSNTAPTAPVVEVTPADAVSGDDLTCTVTTADYDADGDALTYSFAWDVEGVDYTGGTDSATDSVVDGADVGGGETWTCEAVASDATSTSGAGSDSVSVAYGEPTWSVIWSHALTSAPSGATALNGAWMGQGVTTVYGRTAWIQQSDWNVIYIPVTRTNTDLEAVEVDVYVPSNASAAFYPLGNHYSYNGSESYLAHWAEGSSGLMGVGYGGWYDGCCASSGIVDLSTSLSGFTSGSWHTLRVEYDYTLNETVYLLDGSEIYSTTSIPLSTMSQAYVQLRGGAPSWTSANVAWTSLKVYEGTR